MSQSEQLENLPKNVQVAAPRAVSTGSSWGKRALYLMVASIFAAAVLGWMRLDRMETEAKARSQELAERTLKLEQLSKQLQDSAREASNRAAALETKLTEAANQQAQLEKLYANRGSDETDTLLADIEQSIVLANQQLIASGQIASALLLLQEADRSAVKSKNPGLLLIHRLLLKDIERLKSLPAVDLTQMAQRLDLVYASSNDLPLLSTVTSSGTKQSNANSPARNTSNFKFSEELQRLFRLHRVDDPAALMLSPEQEFFVRQNTRLALNSARVALFSRNEKLFKTDVDRSIGALKQYFDVRNPKVTAQITSLEQLSQTRIAIEMPSLAETLNAVRAARAPR